MYSYIVVLLLFLSHSVWADGGCNVKNIGDFYQRVKASGPSLEEIERKKKELSAGVNIAEQRVNPEMGLEYLKGDEFGLDISTYTLSAKHVVEYGGKRDKRIARAKRTQDLRVSQLDLALFQSNVGAAISFQRVAQVQVTIVAVREAIYTFNKIIKKFSTRARLNPEETVSLSTLKLALNDYKAQLNDLENEKILLKGQIGYLSNCGAIAPKYAYLDYQNLSDSTSPNLKKGEQGAGLLSLEDIKVNLAQSEYDVQESLGYSDISIGPDLEYREQGNDSFISAGVSVSFAFPLFHTNDGGKLKAIRGVSTQKLKSKNRRRMLSIEKKNLVRKYNHSLKTLLAMPRLKELERKHHQVEKLFLRGVVSISMTIEAHRQQIDFLRSRFDTENDLLSTLKKISLIDGRKENFENLVN